MNTLYQFSVTATLSAVLLLLMLFVGWQEGHLAYKNRLMGSQHGYLSGSRCRFAYCPADCTSSRCLLLQEIQIGLVLLIWYRITLDLGVAEF